MLVFSIVSVDVDMGYMYIDLIFFYGGDDFWGVWID